MTGLATPGGSRACGPPVGRSTLASVADDSFLVLTRQGVQSPGCPRLWTSPCDCTDSRMPEPSAELSQRGSGWPLLTPSLFSDLCKCKSTVPTQERQLSVSLGAFKDGPSHASMAELNQGERTEVGKTMSDFLRRCQVSLSCVLPSEQQQQCPCRSRPRTERRILDLAGSGWRIPGTALDPLAAGELAVLVQETMVISAHLEKAGLLPQPPPCLDLPASG